MTFEQPQPAQWTVRALAHHLPDGLPTAALTILRLPGQAVRRGPWSTLVGQLLLDTVDRCRPVVYTCADEPYQHWPEEGCNRLGPHYAGVSDACGCCPPERGHFTARRRGLPLIGPFRSTVDNLTAALADHEPDHGPSLVLIDNVEHARPYAFQPGGVYDGDNRTASLDSVENTRRCASDLLTFATERSAAPTVACTWGDTTPLPAALTEVARVVITALPCERRRPVTLHLQARRSLQAPWPPSTEVVLPWFDWGFDDRDLDDEDDAFEQQAAQSAGGQPLADPPATPDPWAAPVVWTGADG
ncbi:hypothetical protein [Blastococcus sp. KM273129]|uniref:hypothetical protein n=1 Tax=Blastococcus sp. KM273129 TaxID=2570315 RepID=UPI001F299C87|nr:hypothetical protein [Blastococcus sp. KM273129]MCF6733689.1 hypothetical protein [Blastococcus sp. KM273129]